MRRFNKIEVIDPDTGEQRLCHLVKYEKERYETIRIGSLAYYRNIEGSQADTLEGCVQGLVFGPDNRTAVTRDELLHITGGSLDAIAKGGIVFEGGSQYQDSKYRRFHNVYVYCCSMEFGKFPDSTRMSHFGVSEFFVIDDRKKFMSFVAKYLCTKARTSDGTVLSPDKHYLQSWGKPVRYLSRKNANYKLPIDDLDFFVYQKDPAFRIEQEYRFVWVFFERESGKPIEVSSDPVDIPCAKDVGAAYS